MSHKFIDSALREAGASIKTIRMYRALYEAASTITKIASVDGQQVMSKPFAIRRGVVQGDIVSPLYFILALELILRKYDNHPNKGVDFGGERVHTLGYADDVALIDQDQVTATERVTAIAKGSKEAADMQISIPKTKCMFVQDQGPPPKVSCTEAKAEASFQCPHVGCNFVFNNAHGVRIHAGRCAKRNEFYMEKILAVRGAEGSPSRRFLVRWEGFGPEDDTWEPYSNLPPEAIKTFLLTNNLYNHLWQGARCERCDKPCKNRRGVKSHARFC